MKNKKSKPIYKRREILIGATAITAAGVLAACKENVNGGTPENPEKATSTLKNIIQGEWLPVGPETFLAEERTLKN